MEREALKLKRERKVRAMVTAKAEASLMSFLRLGSSTGTSPAEKRR
jgi:hypothetical protein